MRKYKPIELKNGLKIRILWKNGMFFYCEACKHTHDDYYKFSVLHTNYGQCTEYISFTKGLSSIYKYPENVKMVQVYIGKWVTIFNVNKDHKFKQGSK